ncbi:MAG: response regulator transcription factor [Chitinophagaceae bacterium]|nr:response regulator transcription factor [Chitinophagaceae bacterium]
MTTCIIVDDEQHAIDVLEHYVKQIPSLQLLASFTNPLRALELLNREKVDLLFLDIQMPEISGLDFIRAIQGRSKVILTTAYSEFVTEGFELEVEDYLLKPIPFPRFIKAVQRIQSTSPSAEPSAADITVDDYFFVKTELKGKMLRINFKDIDYIESMKNYVAIHHNGIKTMALLTMKDLEERLPAAHFLRIHRSFIIAVDKITAIEGNTVLLRNIREGILLGETYRPAFLEKMRGKMLQ